MEDILEIAPSAPDLARFVFGFVRRKDQRGGDVVRILPETRASVQIFRADSYWVKEEAPGAAWRETPRIGLWGPRLVPAYGYAKRRIDVFAMGLTPEGLRALAGRPPADFVNRTPPAPSFGAALDATLAGALEPSADFALWTAAVSEALRCAFAAAPQPTPMVDAVGRLAQRLEAPVSAIAAEFGLSERHFRRLFTAEYGAPPKVYQRILRFDGVLKRLHPRPWESAGADPSDAYVDQAHLIREFCAFARITPAAYVRSKALHGDKILRSIVVDSVAPPPAP